MGAASLGLGIEITARDLASGTLRGTGKEVGGLQSKIGKLGMAATKIFAGIATSFGTVKAAIGFTEPFGKFEQSIKAVSTIAVGGKEHLQDLTDAAIKAGIETQFSPKEAADGLLDLATAGQTATQAMKTLNPVLDLAAGSMGQLGVSEAARAVVGTLNSYSMSADHAGEVTDKLLKITQMSNFQARDFSTGLAKAAAAGGAFGQSLDDALIVVGLMRNANIDASSASTAYRESVRRLASDQQAQRAVQKAGVDIFDKQTGKMRDARLIIDDLAFATKDMTDKKRNEIAVTALGARGILAFNAVSKASFTTMEDGVEVTLKGSEALRAMEAELRKAGGTAKNFRESMLDTFEGQKTLLKGTLETLQIVAGEGLAGVMRPMVSGITDAGNRMIQYIQSLNPGMKAAIGRLVATLLGVVAGGGAFLAVVAAASLLGPVLVPLAAVALLLGSAFKELLEDTGSVGTALDTLGGFAEKVLGQVKAFASGVWDGFQQVMPEIKDALSELGASMDAFSGETSGATTAGHSLGKGLGKLVVLMVKLATFALDVVNAVRPLVGWLIDLADSFGGVETIIKVLIAYKAASWFAGLATQIAASGTAATVAAGAQGLGGFLSSLQGIQAGGFVGMFKNLAGSMGGMVSKLAGAVGSQGAFALMAASLALAYDQASKLKSEMAEFGDKNFWNELKHDMPSFLGGISDAEYQRNYELINGIKKAGKGFKGAVTPQFQMQGMVQGPTFNMEKDAAAADIAAGMAAELTGPAPTAPSFADQFLAAPVGGPELPSITTSYMDAAVSAATQAAEQAAAAAAKNNPTPTPARATLIVDGRPIADIVTEYQKSDGNAGATPVDVTGG